MTDRDAKGRFTKNQSFDFPEWISPDGDEYVIDEDGNERRTR